MNPVVLTLRSLVFLLDGIPFPCTDESFVRPVTFWIVGDFDKPSGRQLLYDAIKHQVG